jgi:antitoxin (DNA-binding transcriptional repressor) of toxin-antitoxin stability system
MATVTLRELAHDTGRVARLLRAGERIEITDRGKYLATIDPRRTEGIDRREQLIAEGRLRPAQHPGYLPPMPTGTADASLTDAVLAERAAEERW